MKASPLNQPRHLIGFMALKDRIREAIEGTHPQKSRADIARACKVTNAAVTHWLSGDTLNLKADKALALEEATGYRAQWILSGRGTKKISEPYWPFDSSLMERFNALSDKGKGLVEGRLEAAIEQCEQQKTPPVTNQATAEQERIFRESDQMARPRHTKVQPRKRG